MLELIMAISLTPPVFAHKAAIPRNYTCQGKDISPALKWSGLPTKAELIGTYRKS